MIVTSSSITSSLPCLILFATQVLMLIYSTHIPNTLYYFKLFFMSLYSSDFTVCSDVSAGSGFHPSPVHLKTPQTDPKYVISMIVSVSNSSPCSRFFPLDSCDSFSITAHRYQQVFENLCNPRFTFVIPNKLHVTSLSRFFLK